jgi:hypothetical protein
VAPIDRQHLSCHAFIALISPFAVFKKTFAGILHCYFIRRRAIGAGLQLTFEVDAERVRSLLGLEVLALPTTAETISRTLTQLEAQATIALPTSRRIVLCNRCALTRLDA